MGVAIKVDKRGRMVLPKDVRKALGIEGLKMTCGVIGNKVVLENYSGRLFARPLPNRRR